MYIAEQNKLVYHIMNLKYGGKVIEWNRIY